MEEERYSTDDIMAMMPKAMKLLCNKKILKVMRDVLDAAGGADKGITGDELDALTDLIQQIGRTNDTEVRQFCKEHNIDYDF